MRILILGGSGQVGRELVDAAARGGCFPIAPSHGVVDICDRQTLTACVRGNRPDVCVNLAAYTDVASAEQNRTSAFRVNGEGAGVVADVVAEAEIPLIHVSTDFVFDGQAREPYLEDDPAEPLNVYGWSKLAGEDAVRARWRKHLIVRTAWVFSRYRRNFVKTILEKGMRGEHLVVVDDEVGSPTSAADLAGALLDLSRRCGSTPRLPWGTYHCCNSGSASRYTLAECVVSSARRHSGGAVAEVSRQTSHERSDPVSRPAYSVLDCTRIRDVFEIELRPWPEAVDEVVRILLSEETAGDS